MAPADLSDVSRWLMYIQDTGECQVYEFATAEKAYYNYFTTPIVLFTRVSSGYSLRI